MHASGNCTLDRHVKTKPSEAATVWASKSKHARVGAADPGAWDMLDTIRTPVMGRLLDLIINISAVAPAHGDDRSLDAEVTARR